MKRYILLPVCIFLVGHATWMHAQSSTNPDARRAAAVAKVQGHTGSMTTAKGVPNTYQYDASKGASPVAYNSTNTKPSGPGTPKKSAPKTTVKGPAATTTTPKSGTSGAKAAEVKPVTYSDAPAAATTMTVNGHKATRNVRPGHGQEGDDLFTPVSELHFVQFAVYCKGVPVDRAPAIEGLYLLWHPGSKCPKGEQGASYIVKGYTTPEEAKAAVKTFRAAKIDCWYNPVLSGAEVEIIGVR